MSIKKAEGFSLLQTNRSKHCTVPTCDNNRHFSMVQNNRLHRKAILWNQYSAKQLIWLNLDLFQNWVHPALFKAYDVKTACAPKPVLVVKLFLGADMMQSSHCCANKPALDFPHNWWRCTFVLSEHVLRHNNKKTCYCPDHAFQQTYWCKSLFSFD